MAESQVNDSGSRSGGLVRTLVVFGILPILLTIAVIVALTSISTFERERENAETRLIDLAEKIALEIEVRNSNAIKIAQTMALSQSSGMFGQREDSAAYARSVLEQFPDYTGAYFGYEPNADGADQDFANLDAASPMAETVDAQGRFLPYWFRSQGQESEIVVNPLVDMETSLYYAGTKELFLAQGPTANITEPYLYEGKLIVEQTYPIVIDGTFLGIAGVDRALDDLDRVLGNIVDQDQFSMFLISANRNFIATTLTLGSNLRTKPVSESVYSSIILPFYTDVDQQIRLTEEPRTGEAAYYVAAPVATGNWLVVLQAPESFITGPIWNDLRLQIAFGCTAILVISIIAILFTRRLSRRIRQLVQTSNKVQLGEIPDTAPQDGAAKDEIGQLARSFDRLVAYFRSLENVSVAIAEGNFSERLPPRGPQDNLSRAINDMAEKRAAAEDELRTLAAGVRKEAQSESALVELSVILRRVSERKEICDQALSFIAQHLGCAAGAVYTMPRMSLEKRLFKEATYGLGQQESHGSRSIKVGDGPLGEAAKRRGRVVTEGDLSDTKIPFAFGPVTPRQILHEPLLQGQDCTGVVELITVTPMDEDQLVWIKKAVEMLAVTLELASGQDMARSALDAAKHEGAKADALFELIPGANALMDKNGVIEQISDALCQKLGFTRDDLINKGVEILFAGDSKPAVTGWVAQSARESDAHPLEQSDPKPLIALTPHGVEMPVTAVITPLVNTDTHSHILLTLYERAGLEEVVSN